MAPEPAITPEEIFDSSGHALALIGACVHDDELGAWSLVREVIYDPARAMNCISYLSALAALFIKSQPNPEACLATLDGARVDGYLRRLSGQS